MKSSTLSPVRLEKFNSKWIVLVNETSQEKVPAKEKNKWRVLGHNVTSRALNGPIADD